MSRCLKWDEPTLLPRGAEDAELGTLEMDGNRDNAEYGCRGPAITGALRPDLSEFRNELERQFELHREQMMEAMRSALADNNSKLLEEFWSGAGSILKHGNRELNGKPPVQAPPKLDYTAGKDRAGVPLLKWACLVTVSSFVKGVPSLSEWIPENISNGLSGHADTIGGASGLSMLLFSSKPSGGRSRIRCPVGRLWTFVMRRAITTALSRARTLFFASDDENPTELDGDARGSSGALVTAPAWLVEIGSKREVSIAVNNVFEAMERSRAVSSTSSGDSESARSRKKRKTMEQEEFAADEGIRAIKEIRRQWMEKLNHARTEVRSYLYLELMFIFEKQQRFQTLAEMRAAGYYLTFNDDGGSGDLHMGDMDLWQDTAWDVPSTKTYELEECVRKGPGCVQAAKVKAKAVSAADAWNKREFLKLQSAFPSLNAVIKYFKRVEIPPEADERRTGQNSDGVIWWPASETVSLHGIAMGLLMELLKFKTCTEVLCTSPFSLKTVHVIAIALRGLIKKCMGRELSGIEKCATGILSNEEANTGDDIVTVRMEGRRRGKGLSRLEQNRKMKFEMSYNDYVKERDAQIERERNRSSHSNTVQTSANTVDIDDLL